MKVVVTDLNPNKLIVHLSSLKICIETSLDSKWLIPIKILQESSI